jgi:hypothetical protein
LHGVGALVPAPLEPYPAYLFPDPAGGGGRDLRLTKKVTARRDGLSPFFFEVLAAREK